MTKSYFYVIIRVLKQELLSYYIYCVMKKNLLCAFVALCVMTGCAVDNCQAEYKASAEVIENQSIDTPQTGVVLRTMKLVGSKYASRIDVFILLEDGSKIETCVSKLSLQDWMYAETGDTIVFSRDKNNCKIIDVKWKK